jgi:hypothetical protein
MMVCHRRYSRRQLFANAAGGLARMPVSASPLPNGSSFLNHGFDEQMFGAE